MLTINYLLKRNFSMDHVLTDYDKEQLLIENKNGNYSYQCLMKEMFGYSHITVESLLHGWSGIKLVRI